MRRLLWLLLLCAACQPLSVVPRWMSLSASHVTVPIDLLCNLPIATVRVDGSPPLLSVVDTGSSGMAITPSAAGQAHMRVQALTTDITGVDGKESRTVSFGVVNEVALGDVGLHRFQAIVVRELEPIQEAMGIKAEVLLGAPLFGAFSLTIDYARRQLRFDGDALPPPDGRNILGADYRSGVPIIRLMVNGAPLDVAVDTGCVGWLSLPRTLEGKVALVRPAVPGAEHSSINGRARDRVARLDGNIQLGRYTMINSPVDFTAGEGRVCARLLRYFTITFDERNGRIGFFRDDPSITVDAERTTGFGVLRREGAWRIADLIPDIAPRMLQIGDRVVSVNGRASDAFTANDWDDLKREPQLHMVVDRAGQTVELDVLVHELGTF